MEILSPDFWSDQVANASKAWALLIPIIIAAFWAGARSKNGPTRRTNMDIENLEDRLRLLRDQNTDEAKAIADIRANIDQLQKLIKANAKRSVLEPIVQEAESRIKTLAMANRTTDHILTAEKPAIQEIERLEPSLRS